MNKQTIVIYGPFQFPFGDAPANRVYGIARAIIEAGWQVFVVGKRGGREQDRQSNGTFAVDGVQYDSIYEKAETRIGKAIKLLSGGLSYQKVWERNGVINPYAIISYSNYCSGNYWIRGQVSGTSIKFIVDVVEWYSSQEYKRGVFSLPYIDNQLGIRSYRDLRNAIVISRMLERYYSKTIQNIIRIPPTIDVQATPYCTERIDKKLKLVYAGSPSKKDYLPVVIEGLARLTTQQRQRIEFHIYGVDNSQLLSLVGNNGVLDSLSGTIYAHGRVPRNIVLEALQSSDFMVLLRPQMRYANAGFPSKVPESLAVGTPVMLNYTSDLSMYIRDGHEGIIVEECSAHALTVALHKALILSREELNTMRVEARKCASSHFDYRNYIQPLKSFLENAK